MNNRSCSWHIITTIEIPSRTSNVNATNEFMNDGCVKMNTTKNLVKSETKFFIFSYIKLQRSIQVLGNYGFFLYDEM